MESRVGMPLMRPYAGAYLAFVRLVLCQRLIHLALDVCVTKCYLASET